MSRRRERPEGSSIAADRGQLSMPIVEAGIGVVLILSLAGLLALGTPAPQADDPQLEVYAEDVAVVLAEEPPRHGGTTRLDELTRSRDSFEREAPALERRVEALLPENLLYRIETPHGAVGFERPGGAVTGAATVTTQHGVVRVEVWHP
ncbi:hypothetical protein L593_06875 [Salinarchaeum sp. Harcht-Bsk1]|uniref:DUF7262 family protein n=1 Tax=Salinarchaeum sp. Harcht-Bsk1 TaxID=1333523 RepID=UPI0003423599|nr:hypothetical protein [Salinarchaeum sp. Harcht-Bsk1]AGN01322.1 hypothetical protein L593_06875 [Salinarchaeum sp. Harcht-Bsk1]